MKKNKSIQLSVIIRSIISLSLVFLIGCNVPPPTGKVTEFTSNDQNCVLEYTIDKKKQDDGTIISAKEVMEFFLKNNNLAIEYKLIFLQDSTPINTFIRKTIIKGGYEYTDAKTHPLLEFLGIEYTGEECNWVQQPVQFDDVKLTINMLLNTAEKNGASVKCTTSSIEDKIFLTQGTFCTKNTFEEIIKKLTISVPLIKNKYTFVFNPFIEETVLDHGTIWDAKQIKYVTTNVLEPGTGGIVNPTTATNLNLKGTNFLMEIHVDTGFSVIGTIRDTNTPLSEFLVIDEGTEKSITSTMNKLFVLWSWDVIDQKWISVTDANYMLLPGRGYFIEAAKPLILKIKDSSSIS